MIPQFPKFKKLELSDREEVEKFTSKFPPYSDFNFSNMWAWDLKGEMGISILNGNLVVKFTDYINGEPFLSFLGDSLVSDTVKKLITFSRENYHINFLKLIPEFAVESLDKVDFEFIRDPDSCDYIYSIEHLSEMNVWKGHTSGKNIRNFLKTYSDYTVEVKPLNDISQSEYIDLFQRWARYKKLGNFLELKEYQAFERFLKIKNDNIKVFSLYETRILVGFTMYEIFSNEYAVSHFAKADSFFLNKVSDILNWEESKILRNQGVKYFNWEQDLGIEGLRKSKQKYKPEFFLNQFTVKMKE